MPIYAKVGDGSVKGNLTARDHEGWFEVTKFEFGQGLVSDARSGATAADEDEEDGADEPAVSSSKLFTELIARAKKMRSDSSRLRGVHELFSSTATFNKFVDNVSHDLMNWSSQGEARRIQFDLCAASGAVMLKVIFKLSRVTKYTFEGPSSSTKGNATETVTLNWEELEIHSYERQADGSLRGPYSFTWTRPAAPPARTAIGDSMTALIGFSPDGGLDAWGDGSSDTAPTTPEPDDSGYEQMGRKLKIGTIGSTEFALEAFTGEESMSQLFKFKLWITANTTVDPKTVIGKEVSFSVEDESGIDSAKSSSPRHFHGVVRRLRAAESGAGDARRYEAIVVPKMWRLTKRSDCRIFQNKKISEIAKAVCEKGGMPASYLDTGALGSADVKLEYCVQYRETDFDFLVRLFETHGVFFFFRHESSKHTLVLSTATTAYQDCDPSQLVQSSGVVDGKHVSRWSCSWEVVSKKAILASRDVSKANSQAALTAERANNLGLTDTDALELYDYSGKYLTSAEGNTLATAAIEAEESAHEMGSGESSCDQLGVGLKFSFKEDEGQSDTQESYVVVRIRHSAEAAMDATGAAISYTNRFTAIPATRIYRPRRRRERPFIIGPQTAVVVAPDGEEIHTDEFGRIKVRFHWDREPNVKPEERSCWIRLAQGVAGNGWGMLALPRKDQEVVVEFIDGDPDRPLVTGSVYNGQNKPTDAVKNKTQTVLRTRSSKEGTAETFNELTLDDKKGEEKIFFHCEKDFERVVKHDDKLTIGKDDEGSRTVVITKDSTLTINKGHRVESIKEGNDTLTIEKGDRTIEVKTGKETVTIKADRTVTIQSGNDTLEVTSGDHSVKAGGKATHESTGAFSIKSSGGKVTIESPQSVELIAGSSKIKVGAAGIVIESPSVKINGKMETKITGTMISAEASGVMKAKGSAVMLG